MYQLRKVYSTISFEANKVKLLVVERNTNTTNCLYYDEFEQEYLDRAFSFINIDALVENIQKMLKNADIFLGRPIRRHVVHIPCLPTISVHDESPNFLIFNQQLDEYKYFNFVNKIKRCVINDNRTVIKIYPKEWTLDNQKYHDFPLAFSGKQISFTYQALTCQTQHLTQFVDLLKQVNIQPLSITNNSLCLGNYFGTNNGMDKLVIDVKTSQTIINLYDKEGVIKKMVTFNEGVNAIIRELKSFMNFTTEEKLTEIINASKNLQEVNDQICLVNIHSEEFLVVKEINYKCFNECVKLCVYRFFKKIETFIENICQSEHAKINKVYMVCTDSAINVFNDNCPSMLCGQYEIGMLKCHIIGLEDVNIISAISALNYVYNEQEESGKYVYSVDEYVSEEASEIQARQSLWLKLGVVSTRWAAKLGE